METEHKTSDEGKQGEWHVRSELTTLCYVEQEDCYLMLHRVKKEQDVNKDKWIGIGGHFENGESPEECLLREAKEETGLTLTSWRFRGIVTFCFQPEELVPAIVETKLKEERMPVCEYMCLYTADGFEGELTNCLEGSLKWVPKAHIPQLNIWEGDRIFLDLLAKDAPFFSLKLSYVGNQLVEAVLDGKNLI